MNPASVMKLVTTYAALDLLGPAFTWKTEALADSLPAADGRLAGNLYLRGSGDPKFAIEHFSALLRQLRVRGVQPVSYTHLDVYKRQGYGTEESAKRTRYVVTSAQPRQASNFCSEVLP